MIEKQQDAYETLSEVKKTNAALKRLQHTGSIITSEVELKKVIQIITDTATQVSGANCGVFFYNEKDEKGEQSPRLYTISGNPEKESLPLHISRRTPVFETTLLEGELLVSGDVTQENIFKDAYPGYGRSQKHIAVKSFLSVPVKSPKTDKVLGGMFFIHSEPGKFDDETIRIIKGIADQGGIAMENAQRFEKEKKIEAQLESKARNLEVINSELTTFAYTLSHDLKNPLSSLLLAEELSRDFTTVEEYREIMKLIEKNSQKIKTILEGVSRLIESESSDKEIEAVNLESIINELVDEYQEELKTESIQVNIDMEIKYVSYIHAYICSIFRNLFSNAIKYADQNKQSVIHLSSEKVGKYICLKCIDNGIGIDLEKHKDSIFQPFKRFTKVKDGSGIGLYLINRMISKNGGYIHVKSAPGEGTTFSCFLIAY